MLASPSSPFLKNGIGLSMHPSVPSPRQSVPTSQKTMASSDKAIFNAGSPSRPRGMNYQNASTQYSPLGDTGRKSPLQAPAKQENTQIQGAMQEPPLLSTPSVTSPQGPGTASPSTLLSQQESPKTRRRQFKETVEAGSASAATSSFPPKRNKASKTTAKMLPMRYEHCEVEDMVVLIADMISELIETNDNLPLRDVVLTRFHSRTPPGISVIDYLQRLAKHATLSPPLLLSMVYYIDRLCLLYPAFSITSLTVHRFLITAATVAAKGLSDSFWNNSTYARVGGIKLAELGLLELEFLYRLDWRIVPNPEVLVDYYRGLIARNEDYTLGSNAATSDARQEVLEESPNSAGGESSGTMSHIGTDTKWEKWMKDVADNSEDPE